MACQWISDSTPPISRPRNDPATAATMFTPNAIPRWFAGNASVRIADDAAISIAPPTHPLAPPAGGKGEKRRGDRGDRKDEKPGFEVPTPAELAAGAPKHHDNP